jgi:protein-L-isoaspartate O-methyltransferase
MNMVDRRPFNFEMRYRQARDPWRFATSEYERDRYQTLIASLSRRSYRRAFEPACSVGELTARLAQFCDSVVASDVAPSAVESARQRCRSFSNVQVYQSDLSNGPPHGPFDLIVFSEVGYYFDRRNLIEIALDLAGELETGGEFVALHWLGRSRDHVLHGDAVHSLLTTYLPLEWRKGERHAGFRIDTWIRA